MPVVPWLDPVAGTNETRLMRGDLLILGVSSERIGVRSNCGERGLLLMRMHPCAWREGDDRSTATSGTSAARTGRRFFLVGA